MPSQYYRAFAKAAGCTEVPTVFDGLANADTSVLQNASSTVSKSGEFGTFALLPVTDGNFIEAAPSLQLFKNAVRGKRLLVGVSCPQFSLSNLNLLTVFLG